MEISIRVATEADIPVLREMIPTAVRRHSAGYYTPQQIESAIRYVFGVDTQLIADGTYFVAEAEGMVVGCGGWSKRMTLFGGDQWKEEADPLLDPKTDAARVRAFFVHADWGRRGIGWRIMEACEAAAGAAGFARTELVATLPGEPLYLAMGYEQRERFEIAMGDGTGLPAVRMGRTLAES